MTWRTKPPKVHIRREPGFYIAVCGKRSKWGKTLLFAEPPDYTVTCETCKRMQAIEISA